MTGEQFDAVLIDLNYTRDTTSGTEGLELLGRLASGLAGARDPAGEVQGHHVLPLGQQRLVDGDEVAHRRLRRGGQRVGPAQLLEERVVVGDVPLLLGPFRS